MSCRPSERVAARVFGPPQKRAVADAAPSGWYPALREAVSVSDDVALVRHHLRPADAEGEEAFERVLGVKDATIKALADALERTGAVASVHNERRNCGCIACDAARALRLAGRLPKETP